MPRDESLQNLKKYSEMSPEERHDFHSKGGQTSTANRRRRKTQAEIIRQIMDLKLTPEEGAGKLVELGLDPTWATDANVAVMQKARRGDVESLRYLRDTIGEKPRDGLDVGVYEGQPVSEMDLSQLSDEQLRAMIAAREADQDA